jgi:DNA modification methylase
MPARLVTTMAGYALLHADAVALPLADASVDAIITSPPYFALRSYQDDGEHYDGQIGSEATPADFLAALWAVTDECWRVLKPTGSMFVDLGDKYAGSGGPGGDYNKGGLRDGQPRLGRSEYWARMTRTATGVPAKSLMGLPWRYALGLSCPDPYRTDHVPCPQWTLRAELVWSKPNGLPESVTDRVRRSHETWFHFTKGPRYYAAVDEVREAHDDKAGPPSRFGTITKPGQHVSSNDGRNHRAIGQVHDVGGNGRSYNPLGKLPGSVWTIPSEPLIVPAHLGVDHFAAFPQEWPRRLILGWTPNGICTACGEGRRPVVQKEYRELHRQDRTRGFKELDDEGQRGSHGTGVNLSVGQNEATITGYACACDVTLAPTRPAVVLDPFVGTGTVPMVARALGRHGIGVDLSRDYLRLAAWRIAESRHNAKSIARTNRERQGLLW